MKYIMMCIAACLLCFGLGGMLSAFITRKLKKGTKKKSAALTVVLGILIMLLLSAGYLSVYYHADKAAVDAAFDDPMVNVTKISGGYYFDGPGEETAFVFYPGAKVDTLAYAQLMNRIAGEGVDCFLADVPFHMAMFGSNLAADFMAEYDYEKWMLGGHSMGGIVATGFAVSHAEDVDAIVLLASYPTKQIPDDMKLLSIYGSNDGCLGAEAYESHKVNWPKASKEVVIEGGNHAGFGNYGAQKGDGPFVITADEEQKIVADEVAELK